MAEWSQVSFFSLSTFSFRKKIMYPTANIYVAKFLFIVTVGLCLSVCLSICLSVILSDFWSV